MPFPFQEGRKGVSAIAAGMVGVGGLLQEIEMG